MPVSFWGAFPTNAQLECDTPTFVCNDIKDCGKVYELKHFFLLVFANVPGYREALPVLEKEYRFWMQNRSVALKVNGQEHVLNRYHVQVGLPRYVGIFTK